MSDHRWTDRLSDFIDGDLPPGEAAALEEHLASCASCRRVLRDLERVRDWGRRFDQGPVATGWPALAARIRDAQARPAWRRPSRGVLAAAAALVLAFAGAAWLARSMRDGGSGPPSPAPFSTSATAVGDDLTDAQLAERVAALESLLAQRRTGLPPDILQALEESLSAIDRALDELDEALGRDPDSRLLRELRRRSTGQKIRTLGVILLAPRS